MPSHLHADPHKSLRPLALALLACGPCAAGAEESPYYIGASAGVTHETNVFRRPTAESDTITRAGVVGGLDLQLGRQRVFANGTASANRFQHNDQLNYTSYGLNSGINWQTIERLSGTFYYSTSQSLASFGDPTAPNSTAKNVQRNQQLGTTVRYGIMSNLAVEGGLERHSVDFSAPADIRTFHQHSANVGLRWGGTGILALGVGVRGTHGEYPRVQDPVTLEFGDKTSRRDVDFTATWQPTGLSTLNGRISATHETHSLAKQSEFSGVTGLVAWDYRPTGRTRFNVAVSRDTGSETIFYKLVPILPDLPITFATVDTNRFVTALSLGAAYEVSAKIGLTASLQHSRNSTTIVGANVGNDTLNVYALGASYVPLRSLSLNCSLAHESRSTPVTQSNYGATTVGCSAQVTLR